MLVKLLHHHHPAPPQHALIMLPRLVWFHLQSTCVGVDCHQHKHQYENSEAELWHMDTSPSLLGDLATTTVLITYEEH